MTLVMSCVLLVLVMRSGKILMMPSVFGGDNTFLCDIGDALSAFGDDLFTDYIGDTCIAGSDPNSQLLVMLESKGDATTRN